MADYSDAGRSRDSGRPRCPVCNGTTYRIPRRFVNLLLSIFMPVRRYRCRAMSCSWEGNLREKGSNLLNTLKEK